MYNRQVTEMDVLIETHVGLERQGPGSPETVVKALSFLDNLSEVSRVADIACGTGGQTMVLAKNIAGNIIGVDISPDFIGVFNDKAQKLNLNERVKGIIGSMDELPFEEEEFDLIWSEGAIDNIGFEKGISYWRTFLKKDGYIAVSCPSWLTDEHPSEVEKFWADAGSSLDTVGYDIEVMQKSGYNFIAAFTLPETDWIDGYFIPRTETEKKLLKKYAGNRIVEKSVAGSKYEVDLYLKYKQHYGYVFYIGKKI
jgi:SAM-dependent methyltransferase